MQIEPLKDLKIKLFQRPDGTFQADTNDDRHGAGDTRGAALVALGNYIDETDALENKKAEFGLGDGAK